MNKSYKEDNKRLAKNTIVLYIRTAMVMIVSLYVSRILLQILGVNDFGIYNVVGSIVVLFSFLNGAMTAASQRFITYTLPHNNIEESRKVFSASLTIQVLLAFILILLVESFGIWFLNSKLNIPSERLYAANVAFQFSIATFSINMLRVPYESTVIANERMTFFAYASIFDALLKLSIVFALRIIEVDKLIVYASLLSVESLTMLMFYIFYCRLNFRTCVFCKVKDKKLYKNLFAFSGWSLASSATNVATQNGFIFFLNMFYGVAVNAAMGIANQVNAAVTNFIGSFQTSYRPQIVKAYSNGDNVHLNSLVSSTSKMSFALMIIPTLILMINMPLILNIWLVNVPNYAVEFCQLILVCLIIDAISGSYNAAIMATGKIRNYQILISLSFLLDLIVSFIILKIGVRPYLVLFSRIATRGILNMIIGLYFIKKEIKFNVYLYLKQCLCPIVICLILCSPFVIVLMNKYDGWILLFASSLFITIMMTICMYIFLFTKTERQYILKFIHIKKADT